MGFHYLLTYTFFTIFRQACEINTVSYAARDSARAETLIDEKCIQKGEAILSGKKNGLLFLVHNVTVFPSMHWKNFEKKRHTINRL